MRDGGQDADVQRCLCRPALPGPGRRLLRVAARSIGQDPFAIARQHGEPVAFGGVWDEWHSPDGETLLTFATTTTTANPELALIQERMPVILEKADWKLWLGEEIGDVQSLLRSLPAHLFLVWPVGRKVNSVKNDGPGLLTPEVSGELL